MDKFPDALPDPSRSRATDPQKTPRRAARPVAAPLKRVVHVREPLSIQAQRVMTELRADEAAVGVLADRFPHVLNRLAASWGSPTETLAVISELLVDRRGNRHGFPREALDELLLLQRYCVTRMVASSGLQDPAP
jgi:DNA-directed RNA polymerase subunit N (RpoN/RPB10)